MAAVKALKKSVLLLSFQFQYQLFPNPLEQELINKEGKHHLSSCGMFLFHFGKMKSYSESHFVSRFVPFVNKTEEMHEVRATFALITEVRIKRDIWNNSISSGSH